MLHHRPTPEGFRGCRELWRLLRGSIDCFPRQSHNAGSFPRKIWAEP